MTWGKTLWWVVILKVFILFFIFRLFFFRPAMAGMTEDEKVEQIGNVLTQKTINQNN